MIHPHTELRTVSPEIGVGVFATRMIPKGTIVYVEDPLEIVIPPDHKMFDHPVFSQVIDTYAVINARGDYEISWDYAKYVNHCCRYNTICTGFGIDIAVRDIQEGEQILEDYGMFNVNYPMELVCIFEDCRKVVRSTDFDRCSQQWEADALEALRHVKFVPQLLWDMMYAETRESLEKYLQTGEGYISINSLRLKKIA